MPVEESAIELVQLPELWPPLHQVPGAYPARSAQAPPRDQSPAPAPEQGPPLPRQFAVLLVEVLAGVRPARQVTPWLTKRGALHLHQLMPLFQTGHQPRVLRVIATRPTLNVVEMTMIAVIGPRPRAIAIRLEHSSHADRWLCTDIESA